MKKKELWNQLKHLSDEVEILIDGQDFEVVKTIRKRITNVELEVLPAVEVDNENQGS